MDILYLVVFITLTSICSAISPSTNSKNGSSCCKNGGVCYLGSFCKCPEFFTGRFCQHEINYKSCKHIPHGYWIRSDCNKCRCFNGRVICIPKYYFGCEDDDEPLDPTKPVDPFSGKTITTYAKDPDVHYSLIPAPQEASNANDFYYDDYYYRDSSASFAQVSLVLIVCFLSIRFL